MNDHPNKHIREALDYALEHGWRLRKGARGRTFGGCCFVLTQPATDAVGRFFPLREFPKTMPARFVAWWTIVPTSLKARSSDMQAYTFTVILGDHSEMTEELAEALAAAGCDDGLAGSSGGVVAVMFDREAESLEQAVRSAIADVQKAGCRAAWVRIEPEDLVGNAPTPATTASGTEQSP